MAMAVAALDWLADRVVLFRCGGVVFVTFGLFAGAGALATLLAMGALLVGQGVALSAFLAFALGASAALVAGSWLVGQALDWRLVLGDPWRTLRRPVFVSWGGLVGLLLALAALAPACGVGVLALLDVAARTVPLGHALGRLGCLSYGCCFGIPTPGRLAITYRSPEAKAVRVAGLRHVPLHPAALYEAVLDLGLLLLANAAAAYGAPSGVPAMLVLALYGTGRFAIEFVRDNGGRELLPPLSVNHVLSLGLAAVGGLALPVVAAHAEMAPAMSWVVALAGLPRLLPVVAPAAAIVFVGFSVHRGRVGEW